jgi:D-alanine-D-alanine ligase
MTKIVVLCGGDSAERAVSLRSGAAVTAALTDAGYDVRQLDPAQPGPDYDEQIERCDVVFPALHGKGGEDGTMQAMLEAMHKPYVGADSRASALCFDKWIYKQKLQAAGLPVPVGQLVDEASFWQSLLIQAPFVLKPFDGGSSVDTFIMRDIANIDRAALTAVFAKHGKMLLEVLVDGQEITVPILGDEALPVIEIIPPDGGEFDYENKYNDKTQELCPPVSVPVEIQKSAQELALKIHHMLGIRDLSRTDMLIDGSGSLFVLETNTMPGLPPQSLLPKAAAAAGYSMADLTSMLVEAALKRK